MNPELIERFFLKQCTSGEAKEVADFLKANPSVLEEYLSTAEWRSLTANNNLPQEFWDEVWQSIQHKNKNNTVSLKLKRFAVAASIILIAGLAIFYFNPKKEIHIPVASITKLPEVEHRLISNTTKKIMTVNLEDNSVVELSPASSLQFDVPFAADKRNIILEGEAKFHVAKNKKKPFTVYAGALATTALGTIFSVKKNKDKNSVTVKLYEGKVVIHSTDKNLKGWKDDVYLLPGNQMKFDALLKTVAINNISNSKPNIAIKQVPAKDSVSDQLIFNNTVLPAVMNKLSAYYKANIQFDVSIIDTMNFTGTISKKDSLPFILKAIAQMNDLEILKDSSGFIISKHQ